MQPHEHITVGTFVITTDNFLLLPPSAGDFIDVSPEPQLAGEIDQRFDGQFVSILGHQGERHRLPAERVPSLIAWKLVLQKEIQLRAFEIFQAGHGESAVANWLRAEAELLGVS
jgi:hypothetical protein